MSHIVYPLAFVDVSVFEDIAPLAIFHIVHVRSSVYFAVLVFIRSIAMLSSVDPISFVKATVTEAVGPEPVDAAILPIAIIIHSVRPVKPA